MQEGCLKIRTVEAYCYVHCDDWQIDLDEHISSSNQSCKQLIAGRFNYIGLRQLHTKQFCMQLTKAYMAEMSCNQLLLTD